MALTLNPSRLKRYTEVARVLYKYGRSDLVRKAGLEEALEGEPLLPTDDRQDPRELAEDLEKLGPAFVKLGQLLSTRPDLLPPPYLDALARLQDDLEPFSFADVERTIQEDFGMRLSKGFAAFESEPVAAASLGQVHRAQLRDGREIAVKVQRPGIRERMVEDLAMMEEKVTSLTPLTRQDIDAEGLARELFRAYLHQIIVNGFFHADPHPGNVFLTDDGRIGLLDLGMVSRLTPQRQDQLLKLLLAVSETDGRRATALALQMGEIRGDLDEATLLRDVQELLTTYRDAPPAIIGAAMLMRVETNFRILGYPAFAMLFFLVAATGAIWLAFNIIRSDLPRKRHRRGA